MIDTNMYLPTVARKALEENGVTAPKGIQIIDTMIYIRDK